MFQLPFQREITYETGNVLLLGIGGGYDIYAALPLYFELAGADGTRHDGRGRVVLANLSFVHHLGSVAHGSRCGRALLARASDFPSDQYREELGFPENYFPELHLSRWFADAHGADVGVYAIDLHGGLGVMQYAETLREIVAAHAIDSIVLIDSGVDSLVKHDEYMMGTVGEDLLSCLAVRAVSFDDDVRADGDATGDGSGEGVGGDDSSGPSRTVPRRRCFLLAVGLNTEGGVSEVDFLENMSAIHRSGGFLGCIGWHPGMHGVQQYLDAIEKCIPTNTSINSQIVLAINGAYGNVTSEPLRRRAVCEYRQWMEELSSATSLPDLEDRLRALRLQHGVVDECNTYLGARAPRNKFYLFR